jgi:hypothetical protein
VSKPRDPDTRSYRAAGSSTTGGVKNYFVEQNWELAQYSVAFLKGLKI